jgi:hypothetical protein
MHTQRLGAYLQGQRYQISSTALDVTELHHATVTILTRIRVTEVQDPADKRLILLTQLNLPTDFPTHVMVFPSP